MTTHARDAARVEDAGGARREQEDVGEHRHVERVERQPAEELVVLARVVADLVDDETGAVLDLLPQLEVLRHHLPLVALVVGDDAAEEEVGLPERSLRRRRPSFMSENIRSRPTESMSKTGAAAPLYPAIG